MIVLYIIFGSFDKIINMKRVFSIFLFFISLYSIFAESSFLNDYITKEWNTTDGLPGNTATDIFQTSDGYIYIGTYEGLARYNGFEFALFNKHSGNICSFTAARTVFEDSRGILWIGSNDEGVESIGVAEKKLYTMEQGLPNNSIRAFEEDTKGNIWVGTASGVCYITPEGEIKNIPGSETMGNSLIESLFCDTAGRMWIITSNTQGLYYYTGETFQRYTQLDQFGEFNVTAINQDSFGGIWFALGQQGIVRQNDSRITKLETGTILDTIPTWSICPDSSGSIWFGTEKGIVLYRDGEFLGFTSSGTYLTNSINKIIEDREHNIWVATDSAGIEKISPGKFRTNTLDTAVNAIALGQDNLVWVGTDTGLLCYKDDVQIQNELTEYCKGLRIRHVGSTKNGDILVNAYTKPAQIRYNTIKGIKNWSTDNGLAGDKTRVSIEIANGDLYVGTTTGLSIIKPNGTIKSLHRNDGFDTEYIMCLYEDQDGLVWIGTDGGGIYIMQDEKIIEKITTSDGLAGNVIFKIMQDKDGIYWICTGTGISRYKNSDIQSSTSTKELFNYSMSSGLGTDAVFQMVIDHSNTVWMTSNRGISSVPLSELNDMANGKRTSIDAKFYNQNDGIRTEGVNSTSLSAMDNFGRIWFTLVDGYTVYDPIKNQQNNILPLVHIENVVLDDVELNPKEPFVIPPQAKHLDITYTGLCFSAPERLRFKYMLVGFDSNYCQPTQKRTVSYTNLKPGNYRFLLTVMSSDGIWNSNPLTLEFSKTPLLHQRPFFWVIIGSLVILLIVAIILIRDRANHIRQLQLEALVQLKTIDLEIERDKSERLLRNILPESIASRLKEPGSTTIADRFEEVTVLFSDLVNFTSISEKESPDDIVNALNKLCSMFDDRAEQMGVEKIKTIGDAYMAVCGCPEPNPNHALTIIKFAKGMYEDLEEYNKTAKIKFQMRIGINSGPVVAGVIGKNRFIYDLWGDTVNTASRMESLCSPGKIRMTENVRNSIKTQFQINYFDEENCDVKGKGSMKTYEM